MSERSDALEILATNAASPWRDSARDCVTVVRRATELALVAAHSVTFRGDDDGSDVVAAMRLIIESVTRIRDLEQLVDGDLVFSLGFEGVPT